MNIALPRKGFRGVENTADMVACTNNMAESEVKVKDQIIYIKQNLKGYHGIVATVWNSYANFACDFQSHVLEVN